MKKFLISILSVAILCFAIDFCLGAVLDKLNLIDKSSAINYAMNEDSCANILFFGSSKCHCGYNPEIIEKELGCSAHNYGIEGQIIYMDYFLVDAIIANSEVKPKLIVVDLTYFDIIDYPTYNKEKIRPMFKYYHKNDAAKELIDECELSERIFSGISKLYGYNQSVTSLIKIGIAPSNKDNGYAPKYGSNIEGLTMINESDSTVFDVTKEKYLNKLINLCKENDIQLLLVISPFYQKYNCEIQWMAKVKEIALKNNATLLDYSQVSEFLEHPEWFWDPFHLNNIGADHYSEFIAHKLANYIE